MAAIDVVGLLLLALGPYAAFYCVFVAPKSFVVLLSVFSAFVWLIVLLVTSALFRGFEPLQQSVSAYAGVVLVSVAVEEAARYGVWRMHAYLCGALEGMSRRSGHAFSYSDAVHLALGWGAGHAGCHALFFFASLLPLTTGDGTYYSPTCPAMSIFTVSALHCLGTTATLVAAMLVGLEGWRRRDVRDIAAAPAVHLAAGLLTLATFKQGGCLFSVPAVLALGAASTVYAAQAVWRNAPPPCPVSPAAALSPLAPSRRTS